MRRKIGNPAPSACSFMVICDHLAGKNPLLIVKKGAFAIIVGGADQNIKIIAIYGAVFHPVTGWHSAYAIPHIGS